MVLNDGSFMNAVTRLATSNGWRGSSVNAKFESEHGTGGTFRVEGVPVRVDNIKEFGFEGRIKVRRDTKILVEERLVFSRIPVDQVRARRNVMPGVRFPKGSTKLWGNVEVFVNVIVAEFVRDVGAGHFGAPNFGRGGDGVSGNMGAGGGREVGMKSVMNKALDRDSLRRGTGEGNNFAAEVLGVRIVDTGQ